MQGGAWLIVAMANPSASCAGGTEKSTKFNKCGPNGSHMSFHYQAADFPG